MRKVCGLFVLFVMLLSSSSYAVKTTTAGKWTAEVSFEVSDTDFKVFLLKMKGTKPASGDSEVKQLLWSKVNTNESFKGLVAGANDYTSAQALQWSISKTYVKIASNSHLTANSYVKIYTDNLNDGDLKITTDVKNMTKGEKKDKLINGMVPTKKGIYYGKDTISGEDVVALPIFYQVVIPGESDVITTYTTTSDGKITFSTKAYTGLSSVGEMQIDSNLESAQAYGITVLLDKGCDKYKDGYADIDAQYTTLATDAGIRTGIGVNEKKESYTHYNSKFDGLNQDAYLFFATSAFTARPGTTYKTNSLTIEIFAAE